MIIYLTISCITLCFCVITYLWVRHKRESKKWEYKTVEEVALADDITTRYRRIDGDYPTGGEEGYYPNRDYFIPLREKKEDFLPKKDIKSHKLVERKYTIRRPGVYGMEMDYSDIVSSPSMNIILGTPNTRNNLIRENE